MSPPLRYWPKVHFIDEELRQPYESAYRGDSQSPQAEWEPFLITPIPVAFAGPAPYQPKPQIIVVWRERPPNPLQAPKS